MRRTVTLAIVLAVCAPLSACGSSSPRLPKEVAPIVAAALAQKSVHYTLTVTAQGNTTTGNADVTADSGTERLTLPGGDVVETRLAHDTVYLRGGFTGLLYLLRSCPYEFVNCQDPTAAQLRQAGKYAGRWISIPKGDRAYGGLARYLTLGSVVRHLTPRRELKSSIRESHGTRLRVLRGELEGDLVRPANLTVRASGEPLPVAFSRVVVRGPGCDGFNHCDRGGDELYRSSGRFTKWNEPMHVEPPAHSTPIATVRAS